MPSSSDLLVLITGGTIDSFFDPMTDTMQPLAQSAIPEYFHTLKVPFSFSVVTVCMKDSRELNDEDRRQMAAAIRSAGTRHVLITHGTFTMPETALYLAQQEDLKETTIILTGAFVPLKQFGAQFSDAPFNVGYAVAHAQTAAPGVYVAMHGHLFPAGTVRKHVKAARFEKLP